MEVETDAVQVLSVHSGSRAPWGWHVVSVVRRAEGAPVAFSGARNTGQIGLSLSPGVSCRSDGKVQLVLLEVGGGRGGFTAHLAKGLLRFVAFWLMAGGQQCWVGMSAHPVWLCSLGPATSLSEPVF